MPPPFLKYFPQVLLISGCGYNSRVNSINIIVLSLSHALFVLARIIVKVALDHDKSISLTMIIIMIPKLSDFKGVSLQAGVLLNC